GVRLVHPLRRRAVLREPDVVVHGRTRRVRRPRDAGMIRADLGGSRRGEDRRGDESEGVPRAGEHGDPWVVAEGPSLGPGFLQPGTYGVPRIRAGRSPSPGISAP